MFNSWSFYFSPVDYEATADIDMHIDKSLEESWAMLSSIKH